jgi:putative phosphoribosyl transferase
MDELNPKFRNRIEAGQKLAARLRHHGGGRDVLVLGLPRGGVIVAAEVAAALGVPLDVLTIRKLGVPGHEELAMGAIGPEGIRVVNEEIVRDLVLSWHDVEQVAAVEKVEQRRRERLFRGDRPPLDLKGRTVILVDDGLATGATMRAAVSAARALHAARVIVAVPVAAASSLPHVQRGADEVVCVLTGEPFLAVGYWYEQFDQTSDEEVQAALEGAAARG